MNVAGIPDYIVIVVPITAVAGLIGTFLYTQHRKRKNDNRRK